MRRAAIVAASCLALTSCSGSVAWQVTSPLNTPRARFVTATLSDGSLFAAGGITSGDYTGKTEVYSGMTSAWTPVAGLRALRGSAAAVHFPSLDAVLVSGGLGGPVPEATVELYHAANASFTYPPAMAVKRSDHVVIWLAGALECIVLLAQHISTLYNRYGDYCLTSAA